MRGWGKWMIIWKRVSKGEQAMMKVRSVIKTGDIVKYKKKKWIVVHWEIVCGGNGMTLTLLRWPPKYWFGIFLRTKKLYDEQIEELEILKEKRP